MPPKTILFPTDYSEASNTALRPAVALARQLEARLLVLHVVPTSAQLAWPGPPDDGGKEAEQGLLELLSTVAGKDQKPVAHEFRTVEGDPAREIVRVAEEEQVELVFMATTGRSGLRRLLMGSVARAVMRQAPCGVMTLRQPAGDATQGAAEGVAPQATGEWAAAGQEGFDALDGNALVLLRRAIQARATDVHIDQLRIGMEVRFRIDGRLEHVSRLPHDKAHQLVTQLKVMAQMDIADPFHPQEGRISLREPLDDFEIRVTRAAVVGGESLALRLLNGRHLLRGLDELGMTDQALERVHEMLRLGEGVVLVTGPSGSGKTTTAYSMVHALDTEHRNIVTIEDPPEYRVTGFRQMAVDARHGITITSGLRTLLRMDPDVVLVGEIRDAEAAEIAMRAASSGRYVVTTLHTRDVASTITALRDLHIDNRSLAGNLTGIISQRLVRRLCTNCRRQRPIDAPLAQLFKDCGVDPPEMLPVSGGCSRCRDSGYYERVGIFEVALPDRVIRDAIESGAAEDELRDLLRSNATQSLLSDGLGKVREGITTLEEIRSMTWMPQPV